ncbi:hypothetical protein NDU88_003325 [Pleurodeles waltl]|uniref:Uncharacterized protein n=1 Tax=Pleurodeles waltl TaxID=8319 RepID=A0AAV7UY48_PLEWA|nr:hypothetical protein NDU88_003325 [Pleurodeles waltl]
MAARPTPCRRTSGPPIGPPGGSKQAAHAPKEEWEGVAPKALSPQWEQKSALKLRGRFPMSPVRERRQRPGPPPWPRPAPRQIRLGLPGDTGQAGSPSACQTALMLPAALLELRCAACDATRGSGGCSAG